MNVPSAVDEVPVGPSDRTARITSSRPAGTASAGPARAGWLLGQGSSHQRYGSEQAVRIPRSVSDAAPALLSCH